MRHSLERFAVLLLLAFAFAACGGSDDGSSSGGDGVGDDETAFDLSLSVELMQLCLESYQMLSDFDAGRTFTLPAPYTLRQQYLTPERFAGEDGDGEVPIAFVATAGPAVYVVFRGTKTISEWIADATLTQESYGYVSDGGKTETGFTRVYDTVHDGIVETVNTLAAGGEYDTVYVTGHSLGAALAILAVPEIAARTPFTRPILYNFAGPRAGDPTFAARYGGLVGASWRVVNTNDEVPMLPKAITVVAGPPPEFKPEFLFYEHVDDEYEITFGVPIHSIADLEEDHSSCNYYATLCDQTEDPASCKAKGNGLDECQFPG